MANDPFEFLGNAGDHPNTWILIYGPLAAVVLLALIATLVILARRKRERKELDAAYRDIASAPVESLTSLPTPTPAVEPRAELPKPQPVASDVDEIRAQDRAGWLVRLQSGLSRTRGYFEGGLKSIFSGSVKLDDKVLEQVHEVLYRADVGVATADRLIDGMKTSLAAQDTDWNAVRAVLAKQMRDVFSEAERPFNRPSKSPWVILVVGVNGVGKTTTIGKLAARFKAEGQSVMLCAADTFRAAAIDQLQVWGERNGVPVIKQQAGADPAAVAFDGVQAAKARGVDILIIDTAGRLHSKTELMAELGKIKKSIAKDLDGAPHETWIVLDATTGQNAVQQCKAFHEVTSLSGIVVTKLDGTAKGGVIVGIANQFKLPIRYIGVGEKAADLREFSGEEFVEGML